MNRVEFRLTMPNCGSWNGRWSGEGRNYIIYKNLSDKSIKNLEIEINNPKSWYYRWDDGWGARIEARILNKGERKQKSDGFSGYNWMVDNILSYDSPYGKEE